MKLTAAACSTLLLVLGACSGWRPDVEANAPKATAAPVPATAGAPPGTEAEPMPPAPSPVAPVAAESQAANSAPAAAKTTTPTSGASPSSVAPDKSNQPAPRPAPRPAPAVQGSTVAAKPPAASPPPTSSPAQRSPAAPPLDIEALEQRLKDTHAIGLFTKLSLKNQVDDLLAQFRAHYRANGSPPLTELRQRYDLLMLKVLSLLQDGDPPLAQTIGSSREAIWGILSDPNKLAAISS